MNFLSSKKINNRRREIIYFIDKTIRYHMKDIDMIFLSGSFANNENGWEIVNNQIIPYNDIDITIVKNGNVDKNQVQIIKKELKKEVGCQWIDIDIHNRWYFEKLEPTQKNIDTLHSKLIIYKDDKVEINFKFNDRSMDRKKQASILYFTRLYCFMSTYKIVHQANINANKWDYVNYQLSKAILACVDAQLLIDGIYKTGYKNNVKNYIEQGYSDIPREVLKKAIYCKLNPMCYKYTKVTPSEFNYVTNIYITIMHKLLTNKDYVGSGKDFHKLFNKLVLSFKRVYWLLIHKHDKYFKRVKIKLLQSDILVLMSNKGLNEKAVIDLINQHRYFFRSKNSYTVNDFLDRICKLRMKL